MQLKVKNKRVAYPDVCKFIAMFIVTCGHCAQAISHMTWTNLFGGGDYTIAFHMPLFMLVSGFFIDLDKIRCTDVISQLKQKTLRLFLPALCWYLLYCFVNTSMLHASEIVTFYWFLTSLFICHVIIIFSAKIFKRDNLCWVVALVISVMISVPLFEKVNYMMPFLVIGHFLYKYINKNKCTALFITSLFISIFCLYFWNVNRTVYICPLIIYHFDLIVITNYLYRIIIGTSISFCIIWIAKLLCEHFSFDTLTKYGGMTLVIYTFSLVANSIVDKVLYSLMLNTNEYVIIDVLSICLCTLVFVISKYLIILFRKNRILKLCMCGELK